MRRRTSRGLALALTRSGGATDPPLPVTAGPELRTVISCCSWAENHNQFFLEAPLEKLPPALERQFKLGATPRARFEAPDELRRGRLRGRHAVGAARQRG